MGRARRGAVLPIVLAAVTLGSIACEPRPGKLREHSERSNDTFQVRIEIYDEGNRAHYFEPGCHYRLAAAPVGTAAWRQFATAYDSHCDQDVKSRVRFVNQQTAYVFMQWWYSVTTDAGRTWSTWDVPAHLPGRAYYSPRLIEDVTIASDGEGTMTLNPAGMVAKERGTLATDNFGRTWH